MAQAHGHHGHEHGHEHGYVDRIEGHRAAKDAFFRTSSASPIPATGRGEFGGLSYFAVDSALRLAGLSLQPYADAEPPAFEIPTSDGRVRAARRAGAFTFVLGGSARALTAYLLDGARAASLFVPFLDETSGRETYGAGRYLDLDLEPGDDGTYEVDFNLGYHPYCAYDDTYSCPLTPAENRLPLRIAAGERLPSH